MEDSEPNIRLSEVDPNPDLSDDEVFRRRVRAAQFALFDRSQLYKRIFRGCGDDVALGKWRAYFLSALLLRDILRNH